MSEKVFGSKERLRPIGTEYEEFVPALPSSLSLNGKYVTWRIVGHSVVSLGGEHGPYAWSEDLECVRSRTRKSTGAVLDLKTGKTTVLYEDDTKEPTP